MGQSPRFRVVQTSEEDIGRVYLPGVNWLMMAATIGLVLGFRSSSGLAAAYGVAVSTTFVITTLLAFQVSRVRWGWGLPLAGLVTAVFLAIDLAFFGANMFKIAEGGWFPLVVAAVVWLLMSTWARGRALIEERMREESDPPARLLDELESDPPPRVAGTAVFLSPEREAVPPILRHHLDHARALQETVLILTVLHSSVPRVPFRERLEVEELGQGLFRAVAHYGFMQIPNVPVLVEACRRGGLAIADEEETTYYVGRRTPVPVEELGMARWRARLFAFLSRNSRRADDASNIPPERVIEIGIRVEV